ncbi:MAG: hypothetical protein ACLPSH_03730 [Vulcanimicrobiaceae bacterium]
MANNKKAAVDNAADQPTTEPTTPKAAVKKRAPKRTAKPAAPAKPAESVTETKSEIVETKPETKQSEKPVLRFRLLRNHMIRGLGTFMPNGLAPQPPASMKFHEETWVRDQTNPAGGKNLKRFTNVFDLSHVFTINLPETTPREVKAKPGMPEAFRLALQTREYERALQARDKSERLRSVLKHYSSARGLKAIEVVEDLSDFLCAESFFSEDELKDKIEADNRAAAERMQQKGDRDRAALASMRSGK